MARDDGWRPGYLALLESGELERRAQALEEMLADCCVCPRECHSNRPGGETGGCRAGINPIVSSYCPHFGEEPPISGKHGSGTIFFGLCNLRCEFCQNYQISQDVAEARGHECTIPQLADRMLALQRLGCHNINLVTPTHFVPQIVRALLIAARGGLHIPIVYNTNAYDHLDVLRQLEGIVDIYLPDLKYADPDAARKYSHIRDYPTHARAALKEMFRQVGDEVLLNGDGAARRGMIIRHLVLPNELSGTEDCLEWIATELSPHVSISLMAQYFPAHQAMNHVLLSRRISMREYGRALRACERFGLENVLTQEPISSEYYRPDFTQDEPFTR
ncbi:radical SAM protein [bacterium]|nr:radical SAM protein [bacterium]